MGFLTKHCRMAWEIAVNNCNLILDGLTDIAQRKEFISSLENAIELCCKQILIDDNNHKVIQARKITDIILKSNYLMSKDLNLFFSNALQNSNQINSLYSANLKDIIDDCIINMSNYSLIKSEFEILRNLRNNETHFYIDENNYLTIDDFKSMCHLMTELQTLFIHKNILEGPPSKGIQSDSKHLTYFECDLSTIYNYNDLIRNSKSNNFLLEQFPDYEEEGIEEGEHGGWWYYVDDVNDLYTIAYEIYEHHGNSDGDLICMDILMDRSTFYRRFILMNSLGMFYINKYDGDTPFVIISKNKN